MNYGSKLKDLRELRNATQQDIANLLNIDKTQYCHYENETRTIPIKHLNTLANYYKISIDYICGLTNIQSYSNPKTDIDKIEAGKRLKEIRKELHLSQDKLAKVINTTNSVICAYEKGKTLINTAFAYNICKKYNVSLDYLLGKVDEPKYLR